LLLRHAKSDWSADIDDFHRPIVDKGKRKAQRIGVWLAEKNIIPDKIICSPAQRARVTAEKALKSAEMDVSKICYEQSIYQASLNDLLNCIAKTNKKVKNLLLVGHNPSLEALLLYLVDKKIIKKSNTKELFPPANLAVFDLSVEWKKISQACCHLNAFVNPAKLSMSFPYPLHRAKERRIRPAYYYQQSSVIPYRLKNNKIQILLISSSGKKHFVVPKGIIEPGMTPQQSAEKEALEEAGVLGEVSKKVIDRYQYEKWGANCEVWVYGMKVTQQLDETQWDEKHRGRSWVPVKKALKLIHQPALVPMMLSLAKQVTK